LTADCALPDGILSYPEKLILKHILQIFVVRVVGQCVVVVVAIVLWLAFDNGEHKNTKKLSHNLAKGNVANATLNPN